MKKILCLFIMMCMVFSITGCGNSKKGEVNPSFMEVKESDIDSEVQIIELNNSADYYTMNVEMDVDCVYFYSIGYDDMNKLIDKSIITTMPVGMNKDESVVINATIPNASTPSYAVGFTYGKNTEYYTLDKNDKGKIVLSLIEEKESFFLQE